MTAIDTYRRQMNRQLTVLWRTRYLDAAVTALRALPTDQRGDDILDDILDEDVARLSPLKHADLNCLGRYSFRSSTPAGGSLRPLRDAAGGVSGCSRVALSNC
jgi:hypothetical protein